MNNKILDELERTYQDISKSVKNEEYIKGCKNMYESCRAIIEKHSGEPEWIPCSVWLPEDGTYLCTFEGELCGIDEPFTGMCGIENGVWDELDCVIAWQSLPEPYQPKGE